VFGELAALLSICTVADCAPVTVGANVTSIVQVKPTATVVQLLVCIKFPLTAPTTLIPLTVSAAVPVLVNVTGTGIEVVPALRSANVIDVGDSDTNGANGAPPVPVS